MDKYDDAFKQIGITPKPLPASYNPEEYGRALMRKFSSHHGNAQAGGFCLSNSTSEKQNDSMRFEYNEFNSCV